MKLFGYNLVSDEDIQNIKNEAYARAIDEVRLIMANPNKHNIFLDGVTISGDDLKLQSLSLFGGVMRISGGVTLDGSLNTHVDIVSEEKK